jgi:hypothetical protein
MSPELATATTTSVFFKSNPAITAGIASFVHGYFIILSSELFLLNLIENLYF